MSRSMWGIERTEDAERAVIETANEVWELYPKVQNPQMQDVILYILNNPESDLKQKTIASKLYMNSSYLSTVFATQTGMRFVDYITIVRLKRAGVVTEKYGNENHRNRIKT